MIYNNLLTIITIGKLITLILMNSTFAWQIHFQEDIIPLNNNQKINLTSRRPLYVPSRCKENQLLYPGNQEHDWICDCAPGALYYPETDACYPAYRRGPCDDHHILILTADSDIIPSCVPNPCPTDGEVRVQEMCYNLESPGPCQQTPLNTFVLSVNRKTLRLDCLPLLISFSPRFATEIVENPPKFDTETMEICARGSKRSIQGLCSISSN